MRTAVISSALIVFMALGSSAMAEPAKAGKRNDLYRKCQAESRKRFPADAQGITPGQRHDMIMRCVKAGGDFRG